MVMVRTPDGIEPYGEEHGTGPAVFVHEFAGDHRSWAPQFSALSRRYRCITYNARGYPPSEVPEDPADCSQCHAGVDIPALIIAGDEDEGCLERDFMLKRTMPRAGLLVLPKTGHTGNLEEPDTFNRAVLDFLAAVELGRWDRRDPRARGLSSTGLER
ncbi:alpha/beta fold hydrolase [Nonomuraea aridisoli]|uniref:Alpha/beta hydrolase n=1 Tax=Nonomuraea aridisoli TaxID=2070368 RepID=A0A2W2EY68_9ACTN|nr:alpha/beta hydrolase [Nonomuraea aridisoli]PZG21205.1 hypothetical protein C1J01_07030 [Nonomuraea aridisoli]